MQQQPLKTMQELLQDQKPQPLTEDQVVDQIKRREVETGRLGKHFLFTRNGVMRSGKLTIVNGMLVVNGKETLDMSKVQVLEAS